MSKRTTVRVSAVGCTHVPFLNHTAFDWAISVINDFRPNVMVHDGDLFDFSGISNYQSEDDHEIDDEYGQGATVLRRLRLAARNDAKRLFHLGNHDWRLFKRSGVIPRYIRRALDPHRHHNEFANWKFIQYRKKPIGISTAGPFMFAHGWRYGVNSWNAEALEIARLADQWSGCVVRSHTHRPHEPRPCRSGSTTLGVWSANTGTLADVNALDYADDRDTFDWGPGVFLGEYDPRTWEWSGEVVSP